MRPRETTKTMTVLSTRNGGRGSKRGRECKVVANNNNNNDSLRSALNFNVKLKKSFKNTLRRNKVKLLGLVVNGECAAEGDGSPDLWRPFQTATNAYNLEQKIDLEIKMREGTTKLLAASHHPSQTLEAAKSLVTSNERMSVYLEELQRCKSQNTASSSSGSMEGGPCHRHEEESSANNNRKRLPCPCKARVCVSDIRMPLIWKDVDHFKNKGDYRRFAVFCLMRIGSDVYDTAMINRIDRSMTDITFDDSFVFNGVPHDFKFRLEVYSHVLQDDLSIASTPRKIRHRINDSLSRTVGRKLAASVKDELNTSAEIGPKFELVSHATLTLDDVDNNIRTHDLHLENNENMHAQLPLFGHFCCRLAAQPEFLEEEEGLSGLISWQSDDNSPSRQLLAVLGSTKISMWPPASDRSTDPEVNIPINKDTVVEAEDGEECIRIETFDGGQLTKHHIAAQNAKQWVDALERVIHCHDAWKQAAASVMKICSPKVKRLPIFSMTRKTSLYDETSLKDSPVVGTGDDDHASLPRSRSSSLSSSTSSNCSYNKRPTLPRPRTVHYRFSCQETSV